MNNDTMKYLEILVKDIHTTVIGTIDENGRASTRVIDMMLFDEKGVYFLTANTKPFYKQLMEQKYVSITGLKGKMSISLKGNVENIAKEKLDEIFEKNPYMFDLYPGDARDVLEVFRLYEAKGDFFDITDPSHIEKGEIVL